VTADGSAARSGNRRMEIPYRGEKAPQFQFREIIVLGIKMARQKLPMHAYVAEDLGFLRKRPKETFCMHLLWVLFGWVTLSRYTRVSFITRPTPSQSPLRTVGENPTIFPSRPLCSTNFSDGLTDDSSLL
jgi:hypothetical protein